MLDKHRAKSATSVASKQLGINFSMAKSVTSDRRRSMLGDHDEEVAEAVLIQAFIPKTLDQVKNYERDYERLTSGKDTEGIYYQSSTGLKQDTSGVKQTPEILLEPTLKGSAEASVGLASDADDEKRDGLTDTGNDLEGNASSGVGDSEEDEDDKTSLRDLYLFFVKSSKLRVRCIRTFEFRYQTVDSGRQTYFSCVTTVLEPWIGRKSDPLHVISRLPSRKERS